MKKAWFILLTLGLMTIFSTAAWAVDVKFSGEFFAAGVYWDRTNLTKDISPSTAFYYQRLRLRADYVVSPGLTLVTRIDALERAWGANRTAAGIALAADSAGTVAENENIAFDWAYVNYKSPIGMFDAGLMNYGATGTIFGNSTIPNSRIKYSFTAGPVTLNAAISKVKELSYTASNIVAYSDADNNVYHLEGVYKWKGGLAGLNVNYYRYAENRPGLNSKRTYYLITPYTIAKLGFLNLQAEFNWATGKFTDTDSGVGDVKLENFSGWIDAKAAFGSVYFGGTFAYVSGDDPATTDKREGGTLTGGRDWSPNLIMWNYDRAMWLGELRSTHVAAGSGFGNSGMANAFLYQGRVGVKPTDKLDIMSSFTYANADKKPLNYVSDQYGYELDITATYKLTSNLTYMLGAGYLWTGDYFKGTSANNAVQNDFMVINKLTLTF